MQYKTNRNLIRCSVGIGLAMLTLGSAFGQDTNIPALKRFKVSKAVISDTTLMSPQIAKPGLIHFRPENPLDMQRTLGTPNNLPVGTMVTGANAELGPRFGGIGATGWYPPDVDGGVGQNYVIETVNSSIAFFRKSDGVKTFQQDFSQFFSGIGVQVNFLFDPKSLYDPASGRYFVLCEEEDDAQKISKLLVAVSDDGDPNGIWYKYRIEAKLTVSGNDYWLDYPGFAVNKNWVLMTGNMFGFTSGYTGAQFLVLPKAPMLSGNAVTATSFNDPSTSTAQTARSTDPTFDKIYTVATVNSSTIRVHAISGPANAPVLTSTNVTIPTFTYTQGPVVGPNGRNLDGFDSRIHTAAYRAGSIVTAHSAQVSSSDPRHGCRWYEIDTKSWPTSGVPSLKQVGMITGGASEYFTMPSINMNKDGAISVLATRTSSSIMADVMLMARIKTDPLNSMGVPQLLKKSPGILSSAGTNRWGDYFAVAIDPEDDTTFWGLGETVASNGDWSTEIQSWKVRSADTATVYLPTMPNVIQGNRQSGTAASLVNVDSNFFTVKSAASAGLGQAATWETSFATTLTNQTVGYLAVKFLANGPKAGTEFLFMYNWTTSNYDVVATKPIKTGQVEIIELTGDLSKYVKSDGTVKAAIRGLTPIRNNAMPTSFSYKVDQLVLLGLKK